MVSVASSYASTGTGVEIYISNGIIYFGVVGNSTNYNLITGNFPYSPTGVWVHVAAMLSSNVLYGFVNGVLQGSSSVTTSILGSNGVSIGGAFGTANTYLNGLISNIRIVNGTAVYSTSGFTPPKSHLTAVTGTQLLTLQNSLITDTSNNVLTITNNGTVTTNYTNVPFTS